MHVTVTYFASREYLLTDGGPTRKAASAVSANPKDDCLTRLQSSCEVFTKM